MSSSRWKDYCCRYHRNWKTMLTSNMKPKMIGHFFATTLPWRLCKPSFHIYHCQEERERGGKEEPQQLLGNTETSWVKKKIHVPQLPRKNWNLSGWPSLWLVPPQPHTFSPPLPLSYHGSEYLTIIESISLELGSETRSVVPDSLRPEFSRPEYWSG